MSSEQRKKSVLTIPNLLSLFRIALIPVYVVIYLNAANERQYLLAGSLLAVSCLTDLADGIIARKFQMVTTLGKVLDPLADKLTQFAMILSLSVRYRALYPILCLFLAKELFQCGALLFFVRKGKVLPGALFAGKLCTTVLFISLLFLVLFPNMPSETVLGVMLTDMFFLLYSFVSYITAYFGKHSCLTDWNPG